MSTTSIPNYAAAPKRAPSLMERLNVRMIAFALIVVALLGYPIYVYVESVVTGGVKNVGNGVKQVNLQALGNFPLDQSNGTVDDIPKQWRSLDGEKVVLFGEMYQSFDAGDGRIQGFDLCYSIAKCCFNGPPQVQHFVKSRVKPGRAVYYAPNLVKVTGTLHVDLKKDADGGKLTQVYRLDVDDVEPST